MYDSTRYDSVVIGGGHNGLVAAARLAQSGERVLLLEARPLLGGAAATEELAPGFRVNTGASDVSLLRNAVIEQLALAEHGLELLEGPALAFAPGASDAPGASGGSLTLWRDPARSIESIAQHSPHDAQHFPRFAAHMARQSAALGALLTESPRLGSLGDILLTQPELVRAASLSAAELLSHWFESDRLQGMLAALAVMGNMQGPMSGGTGAMLLYQLIGAGELGYRSARFVRGGVGQLSAALAAAAAANGAEIRTGTPVARIVLERGRALGVRLADGTEIRCGRVLSSVTPRRTFMELVGAPQLEPRFVRRVRNVKYRGDTASVHLLLHGLPEFAGQRDREQLTGHIVVAPSVEFVERAFDAAKYGKIATELPLDITIPTVLEPSLAPDGGHVLSVTVQYAPYDLRGGSWDALREPFADNVVTQLERVAPGIGTLINERHVFTPLDWERSVGLTEGSIYHGEMGLEQMFVMRPMPGWRAFRTPIDGLWLCGSGSHPGGGITGLPGWLAAESILKTVR